MSDFKMVDVSGKKEVLRWAMAEATVYLPENIREKIKEGDSPKGKVYPLAESAGILAVKKVPELIPLAHPVRIDFTKINFKWEGERLVIVSTVKGRDRTGMELEALFSVMVSALVVYDMCKGLGEGIRIEGVKLVEKGKNEG